MDEQYKKELIWLAESPLKKRVETLRTKAEQLQAEVDDAKAAVFNITVPRMVDDLKDTLDEQIELLSQRHQGEVGRLTAELDKACNEVERLREHEKWLKLGHEAADGFLDAPSQSHIVDKICILGHERDDLREAAEAKGDEQRQEPASQAVDWQAIETRRCRLSEGSDGDTWAGCVLDAGHNGSCNMCPRPQNIREAEAAEAAEGGE